ncbi:putative glycine dehydrogenase [Trypanosoma cruzi]|nr:putative glycine dehydrogenase [Trypanosoma cruzi]
MITHASTYGLFDREILAITSMVHYDGGQCYIDGANMNAMVGYTAPGCIGGDVCRLIYQNVFNSRGGDGPGMGPIAVRQHLASFLPRSVFIENVGGSQPFGHVSQAAYGSASIPPVPYLLLWMLGSRGLKKCTGYAILNANYLKKRPDGHCPVLFLEENDFCAHEFIIDKAI